MKYLLDSNIYINFYDRYYRMSYFPTFWQQLPELLNKNVLIPDIVIDEHYQDLTFREWLDDHYSQKVLRHRDYALEWGEVINHVSACGFYKPTALASDKGWARERIADPWLIAIAKSSDYTIVTEEVKNPNLNRHNPSKSAKIPDVCDQLGVRCINMNQFFKEVNLTV